MSLLFFINLFAYTTFIISDKFLALKKDKPVAPFCYARLNFQFLLALFYQVLTCSQ